MKALWLPSFLIISLLGIVVLQYGYIFILLALLPAFVAFYTDNDPRKSSFKTVFAGNLAATLPTLLPMIKGSLKGHYDVISVIEDPAVWMFIYLGAAAGWGLIFLCRYIARFTVTMMFEHNIHTLKKQQQRLVEEWGTAIMPSSSNTNQEG